MKLLWKVLAWIFVLCGISAYLVGLAALMVGSVIWFPTQFWFYDAVATGIFGIFFLMYGMHSDKNKGR